MTQHNKNIADEQFNVTLSGYEINQLLKAVGTATSLWAKNRRTCPASIDTDVLNNACNKVAHSIDSQHTRAPQCPMWGTARVAGIDGDKNEWVCLMGNIKVFPPYRSSSPHTPAPESFEQKENRELDIRIAGFDEGYKQGKEEAARAATLAENKRLLDAVLKIVRYECTAFAMVPKIESLRQSTTAGDEQQC